MSIGVVSAGGLGGGLSALASPKPLNVSIIFFFKTESAHGVVPIYLNTVKTARRLARWFPGKSLKLLPTDVIF